MLPALIAPLLEQDVPTVHDYQPDAFETMRLHVVAWVDQASRYI